MTVQNLESFEHLCELGLDALGEYLRSGGRTGHDQGRQRLISQRLRKKKELPFERSYRATLEVVWAASTDADQLQAWRSPDKTSVTEYQIDLQVGGRIDVVTEAGKETGKPGHSVAHGRHVHPHRRPPAVDLRRPFPGQRAKK